MNELETFFQGLTPISPTSWDRLAALFTPRTLKKGEYFVTDKQFARELAFLETGIVRVFYRNAEGVEYNKQFFTDRNLIGGYTSLITQQQSRINQQALADCVIHVANHAEIRGLFDTCPDIERAARLIAEYFFVQKEQREIDIVLLDAEKRYRIFQREFPGLEQQIPQYHIASYLGVTPTQLSRIRRKASGK